MKRQYVSVLGATGSIGTDVLRVVEAFAGRFEVVGLAAGTNVGKSALAADLVVIGIGVSPATNGCPVSRSKASM